MLIKCPECSKEVSDKATCCLFCGCPLNESASTKIDWNTSWLRYICGLLIGFFSIKYFLLSDGEPLIVFTAIETFILSAFLIWKEWKWFLYGIAKLYCCGAAILGILYMLECNSYSEWICSLFIILSIVMAVILSKKINKIDQKVKANTIAYIGVGAICLTLIAFISMQYIAEKERERRRQEEKVMQKRITKERIAKERALMREPTVLEKFSAESDRQKMLRKMSKNDSAAKSVAK